MATVTKSSIKVSSGTASGDISINTTSGTLVAALSSTQEAIVNVCLGNLNTAGGPFFLRMGPSSTLIYYVPTGQTVTSVMLTVHVGPSQSLTFFSDPGNTGTVSSSGTIYVNS